MMFFGNHFLGEIFRKLLPAHAVAQSNGHGALRVLLPDDVLVELDNDLTRRELVECELFFFGASRQVNGHNTVVGRLVVRRWLGESAF